MNTKPPLCRTGILFLCFLTASSDSVIVSADESSGTRPLVSGKQLSGQLSQRRSAAYDGVPLGKLLAEMQRSTGIAIVLDRRIDFTTSVSMTTGYVTNGEILVRIASHVGAEVSFCTSFVFMGKPETARVLRTLVEVNEKSVRGLRVQLDASVYKSLTEKSDASWQRLARPRELLLNRAVKIGLTIPEPSAIPHDLWRACQLPSLSFAEFATLVLAQFDLTFDVKSDGRLLVMPIPSTVEVVRRHRVPSREKDQVASRWKEAFPDLDVQWRGSTASVRASLETHDRLKQLTDGKAVASIEAAGLRARLFTINIPPGTSIGALVARLRQSEITIRITGLSEEETNEVLQRTVELSITEMPGEKFFPLVFDGIGANVTVTDSEIRLSF